jgi:hypothetical protein
MSRVILLDAGPLGIVSNPCFSSQTLACHQWVKERLTSGAQVLIPEIADYEVRRELLRANKTRSLARLNRLKSALGYLAITTQVMLRALPNFGRKHGIWASRPPAIKRWMRI